MSLRQVFISCRANAIPKYYIYNISSSCSVPLVDLLGGRPVTSHGQHQTVLIEFSHLFSLKIAYNTSKTSTYSLNILAAVLPPLVGDESVALHGDGGRHLPPVRGGLIKLLTQPDSSRHQKTCV